MKLSIIIPAHNEEKRIKATLVSYHAFFYKFYKKNFEIIVVLNGCNDNTALVVKRVCKRLYSVKSIEFKEAGKGFAIKEGFKVANGELIGFTDADNSTSPEAFYSLIKEIKENDAIIASRWIRGAIIKPKQPLTRRIASRAFNMLVRSLFNLKLHDTQCGAKLFKRKAVNVFLSQIDNKHMPNWAFDIDMLYKMKRKGLKIKEIPTVWGDKRGSKLKIPKTALEMFLAAIRLRLNYSVFRFVVRAYDILPKRLKVPQN